MGEREKEAGCGGVAGDSGDGGHGEGEEGGNNWLEDVDHVG